MAIQSVPLFEYSQRKMLPVVLPESVSTSPLLPEHTVFVPDKDPATGAGTTLTEEMVEVAGAQGAF